MSLTYIEKFNFYLVSFVKEMVVIFPEYDTLLNESYNELLETPNSNSEVYVKEYMTNVKKYNSYLAKKDETLFKINSELNFIRGIDFRNVWAKDINEVTRQNIWKYLQTLVVIGKKVVGEDDEIEKLLDNFNNDESEKLPNMENIKEETENMMEMLKNMTQITQNPEKNEEETEKASNPFEGGLINDIAKELTGELNLDNLNIGDPKNMNEAFNNLLGGGNGGNFLDLINKVGAKIQNKVQSGAINQNDLMKEAQSMMGNLKNPEQMAKKMMNTKNPHNGNSTRDRLKKKLEKKNNVKK
tara:strand:- start:832 stop:1728 length:897 start_codon:yes stop_codon:yes gene_type:complete